MTDIEDNTENEIGFKHSCKIIVESDKTSVPDLIHIVNSWISDKDTSIELINILNMTVLDRNIYFKKLTGHSDWFIDELCEAVFKSNSYDDEIWTPIESSPEALVVKNKLKLKYSTQFKTKSSENKEVSHFKISVQKPLHRVFQSLVKSIGKINHTIEVIMEYGLSKHVSLIGDFKYVHGLDEINRTFITELNISQPGTYTEAITSSMETLFTRELCNVANVMNSMDIDKINSTKVDFDIYSLFMSKMKESGLNSSELFSLYLLAFIADSDSGGMYSLVSDKTSNYYNDVLIEYKKLLNHVCNDLTDTLKRFLATSTVYGIKFNDTMFLLSKLAVRDEYYRIFYNIINKNNDNPMFIYTDKEYKTTDIDSLITDMNNTISTYMSESKNVRKDVFKLLKVNDALSTDKSTLQTNIDLLLNDKSVLQTDIDILLNELNAVKFENAQLKKNPIHTLIIRIKAFFKKGVNINGL